MSTVAGDRTPGNQDQGATVVTPRRPGDREPRSDDPRVIDGPQSGARDERQHDETVAEAVNAASLDEHVAADRALDMVLTAGRYVIPVSYPRVSRIAHAARLHFPDHETLYGDWPGFLPDLWWSDAP